MDTLLSNQTSYYLSDFVTGLVASLALRGVPVLSARQNRLDYAFEKVFPSVSAELQQRNLRGRFRIRRDPYHGDSAAVREALYEAAQRNLVSFDNPEFQDVRIKISSSEAATILESLIGGRDLYDKLTSEFLRHYQDFKPG